MVHWDTTVDRALLLNVIDPVAKTNWDRVANAMGDGFSAEACRQRFRKLKNEVLGEGSLVTTNTPTPSKGKRKANGTNETEETPTKKPRERRPKAKEPKTELDGFNTDTGDKEEISDNNERDTA